MNYFINQNNKEKSDIGKIDDKVIEDLLNKEFIDSCENILIETQIKFVDDFFEKIALILKYNYGNDIFKKMKSLNQILYQNKINFINGLYSYVYRICSLALKQFKTNNLNYIDNNIKISYLINYRPHCMKSQIKNISNPNSIAIHLCGGKFIIINDNNQKRINGLNSNNNQHNNSFSFIICTKCKKCYFNNSIPMLCSFCYKLYYSETIPEETKKNNCYLATWAKYHCKNKNNEKMSCIKCGEDFWLKSNKLFCKKCNFEIEPKSIIWTCIICNSDFNSPAKIYNPLEFKETQLILKESLIYKKIVKPVEFPCKCVSNENIDQINFYHKKECKGLLYYSEINNKKFIVCSQCLNIYSINKFKWNCPICFKPFMTLKIKIFYSKEKNNNNYNMFKSIIISQNTKNKCVKNLKNNSRKTINTISILDTDKDIIYFSPNNNKNRKRNELNTLKIRNLNSYVKKKPNNLNKMIYSSSSKDLMINKSNRINKNNIINRSVTNNNSHNKISNKIKKNITINNGCLYSLNIKKRRNLSELPSEVNNNAYFYASKNNKHESKWHSGTGSTIFSSLSNFNLNSQKETLIKSGMALDLNGKNNIMKTVDYNRVTNNKKIINNYNLHKNKKNNIIDKQKNKCDYKIYKRNIVNSKDNYNYFEYSQQLKNKSLASDNIMKTKQNSINPINTINSENNSNNIFSPNNNNRKMNYIKNIENKISYNDEINDNSKIISKKYSKKKKGNKSFCIKDKANIVFSPKNSAKYDEKKRNINNSNINYEIKQKIPFKELNTSKNTKKDKDKDKDKVIEINYFSYSQNNKIKENNYKPNKKRVYLNNLTINNNNSNYHINHNHNNSINIDYNLKKKNNISFEKICKIKNINISINSPKLNNIINYNLSFSNKQKSEVLNKKKKKVSINSKLNNKANISNDQANNSLTNNESNNNTMKIKHFNFDDYKIITQLGQGSFGKIYLVKDSKGNIYSMKKILLSEELDVKNVIREYNMCFNLAHPNIIKIIGLYSNKLDKTTYVVYILMEVGISDWEKEINSHKIKKTFYTEEELVNILKQLISSLSFLQKNKISHRDIKPQNILIFKNKVYKLTDFGEARKVNERDKNSKSIMQYSLKGTELYMSPLLFNGLRTGQIDIMHNTYKSDVYSLGLCMLYAATACDKKLYEIRKLIEMEQVTKFVNYNLKDNFSGKFIDIIISMLEIHEQKRPDFIELEKIMENY